jgi:alpha-methylacyl-CoA racemase
MGPLKGIRVVEFAGLGPAPMAAMLLADLGATVIKVDRPTPSDLGTPKAAKFELTSRGRHSLAVDLKKSAGVELALQLIGNADVLIEGFRPGTMERLGLGPDAALRQNPRLIYGRMTGWGQAGPLSQAAGHDINYIALTGALAAIGRANVGPTPPLNLVGDMGGGALYLAFGIVCALLETKTSGRGQVVDAAMTDGAASLMTIFFGLHAAGLHSLKLGTNLLDGGSAIYDVYECLDGKHIALGAIEQKFRAELFRLIGIPSSGDTGPTMRATLTELFKTRSRDQWCGLLEGSDACFAPVLSMEEAPHHPHNVHRQTFIEIDGITQPAPAPRFSRTVPDRPMPPEELGAGGRTALMQWGFSAEAIDALEREAVIGTARLPSASV